KRATSTARARRLRSSVSWSWLSSRVSVATPNSTTASRIATAEASATRQRSETRDTSASLLEHEPDPAHGPDQGRVAELAAQVGHVAVDGVGAGLGLAAPHLLERALARDHRARVAQQQAEQLGLAPGQAEVAPAAGGVPALGVEGDIGEGQRLGHVAAPQQRAHARGELLHGEWLDQVV